MAKSNHKQIEYVYGSEMVVVNSMRKGNNKRWVVTAYDSNVPPNQAVKKLSPDSGRTINIDLFSPQDGSLRGPDDNFDKTLSDKSYKANDLNSIQRFAHEPVMPRGDEVSDVKAGDVKRLISEALGVPVREGQIRKKGLGRFISCNPYNGKKMKLLG